MERWTASSSLQVHCESNVHNWATHLTSHRQTAEGLRLLNPDEEKIGEVKCERGALFIPCCSTEKNQEGRLEVRGRQILAHSKELPHYQSWAKLCCAAVSSQHLELPELRLNEILQRQHGGAFHMGREKEGAWTENPTSSSNSSNGCVTRWICSVKLPTDREQKEKDHRAWIPSGWIKSLSYGSGQPLFSIIQNFCSVVNAWKEMEIFATLNTPICLWSNRESQGEKKTWKALLPEKKGRLGWARGKERQQRGESLCM